MFLGIGKPFLPKGGELPGDECPELIMAPSGAVLPVSEGGIVRVNNISDIFVLAHDGITVVELERTLSDEFYAAAANADNALVQDLMSLMDLYKQKLENEIDEPAYTEKLDTLMGESPNPVMKQVLEDLNEYADVIPELRDCILNRADGRRDVTIRGHHHMEGEEITRDLPAIHFDVQALTSIFYYLGDATDIIDARITAEEFSAFGNSVTGSGDELYSSPRALEMSKALLEKYGSISSTVGNAVFFKGMIAIESSLDGALLETEEGMEILDKATIRNVAMHTEPSYNEASPHRFASIMR